MRRGMRGRVFLRVGSRVRFGVGSGMLLRTRRGPGFHRMCFRSDSVRGGRGNRVHVMIGHHRLLNDSALRMAVVF